MAACSLYLHLGSSKLQNKNLSFKLAHLIPNVSTNAFHLINLFLFSRHHIPTYNYSLPWPTYVMNSVDKNKLSRQKENNNCKKKISWRGLARKFAVVSRYTTSSQENQNLKLLFLKDVVSSDLWPMNRFPLIGKRIEVGR